MNRLKIPYLSANVTDATLTAWLKQPGAAVEPGDAVAEITTEKATFELEATTAGILLKTLAPERSMLPVGYIVALIGSPGETDPEAETCNRDCIEQARREREGLAGGIPTSDAFNTGTNPPTVSLAAHPATRVRATPKARRIAREHGLTLETIQSETKAEVITEAHVQTHLARRSAEAADSGATST